MLAIAREVQIPVLAALLIGGAAAKAKRALSARSFDASTGPTVLFPLRLRRPVAVAICAAELALGAGLLVTADGTGDLVSTIRVAIVILFGTAVGALHELRSRRPEAGCGCFGELSGTPVTWRSIARAALLGAAALATIGARPLSMPHTPGQAAAVLVILAAEVALLAALSPEIGAAMVRLGHTEPCEVRRVPVTRTLAALEDSTPWRRYRPYLVSTAPSDVWREACWRFVAYPGVLGRRQVDVVFAVSLAGRRVPVRVGVLDVDGTGALLGRTPLHLSKLL